MYSCQELRKLNCCDCTCGRRSGAAKALLDDRHTLSRLALTSPGAQREGEREIAFKKAFGFCEIGSSIGWMDAKVNYTVNYTVNSTV